ncbi:MLO-like protein 10 [Prosopis cineraria]|uniref:MLO-like protein 10 n=1 Tax=Prosopis cineraria TaxID=364024 RepID=UPI00241081A1|nr:MLO-like protein 10 [Prosopis cineraria]
MSMSKFETFLFCALSLVSSGGLAVSSSDSSSSSTRELDQTPTWAVSAVCTVFILISITLEKSLHKIGSWLGERQKKALLEALEKVKAELMILGFISLLLNFGQSYIVRICISQKLADKMLPCASDGTNDSSRRKLLSHDRRYLADTSSSQCKEGYEPLISANGLHQLHILIFFLAVFHVLYSAVTMLLGRLQIRGWKAWEEETSSHRYEFSHDPSRFRLTHETSFVRAHSSFWTRIPIFFYVGCFFRQFYRSVGKADYLTLRNGFITAHLSPGSKFNFQKYIKRSLEDDFKIVMGVSPVLWASFVVFLLLNVNGWRTLLWASLLPVIIILAVGTKLQATLTRMALEITDRHAVVQGMPLVQGSDKYFWFGRPQLVLYLIHFALFQNAFQITYFLWIWYSFGLHNCFHADYKLAIIKVALGIAVLCLCSYITLPLHALVTQMGSRMKKSIFDEQTSKALKKWHNAVKKRREEKLGKSSIRNLDGGRSAGTGSSKPSSGPALHRFKTTGHSTRSSTFVEDEDGTDLNVEHESLSPMVATTDLTIRVDHQSHENEPHSAEGDLSFGKSETVEVTPK